jgi:hypothetical protein
VNGEAKLNCLKRLDGRRNEKVVDNNLDEVVMKKAGLQSGLNKVWKWWSGGMAVE